jgi:hypothetical protein
MTTSWWEQHPFKSVKDLHAAVVAAHRELVAEDTGNTAALIEQGPIRYVLGDDKARERLELHVGGRMTEQVHLDRRQHSLDLLSDVIGSRQLTHAEFNLLEWIIHSWRDAVDNFGDRS